MEPAADARAGASRFGQPVFQVASAPDAMHVLRFGAFDTRVKLSAYGEEALVRTAFRKALADCRRFEGLFSRALAGGDIARLNAAAGGTLLVEDDTYDLLAGSLRFCEASHGLFDVTIGPVVALWDFKRGATPERGALDAALEHVGYRNLVLGGRPGARTARLADARAAVDAGGTAKGYIADRLCERLESLGLERFVVDLGGNVAVRGLRRRARRPCCAKLTRYVFFQPKRSPHGFFRSHKRGAVALAD